MTNTSPSTYDSWTREDLIAKLIQLDRPKPKPRHAPDSDSGPLAVPHPRQKKPFDFSSHARRKIALKFCYSGWEYGGLAFQNVRTPLPTVEGVLFDAMAKARLIDPQAGFDGCGWEKCGRTDRGVSAAGQVISLWIRSALRPSQEEQDIPTSTLDSNDQPLKDVDPISRLSLIDALSDTSTSPAPDDGSSPPNPTLRDPINISNLASSRVHNSLDSKNEHDYLCILNRLLPPTIRILAWSPVSPTFSARFACTQRHYKYFFSPAGLDIPRMRDAASRLVGDHDFRNLCKLDPAKQITIFQRRIMRADIDAVDPNNAQGTHVLNLVGSAFLYHQVRHIMAILFLVGTGLEHPSLVSSLMNVEENLEKGRDGDPELRVVDCKPEYQMADALPLMLWDCGYPETELDWRTGNGTGIARNGVKTDVGTEIGSGSGNGSDLYHQLQSIHSRSEVYTTLDQHFLSAASRYHPPSLSPFPLSHLPTSTVPSGTLNIPLGGGTFTRTGKYVPVLERHRLDAVGIANERWRLGKGFRREERKKGEIGEDRGGDDDGDE